MNINELTHPKLIVLDQGFNHRDEVIHCLANKLEEAGKLVDKNRFVEVVMQREQEGPTALGESLAVPHGKSNGVKEAAFAVARLKNNLAWEGVDGPEPVNLVIMLAIPLAEQGTTHIEILTELTRAIADDELRNKLMEASTPEQFLALLTGNTSGNNTPQEHQQTSDNEKVIVAVTACPTGIAHTYMAADYLEKAAKRVGITLFVEKQGAKGIETPITTEQLHRADAVILASDVALKNTERFNHLPVLTISVAEPIRNADAVIKKALQLPKSARQIKHPKDSNASQSHNKEQGSIKQALLTGVSHAIPFIAAGGIMIATAIAFAPMTSQGPDFSQHAILKLVSEIGGAAFAVLLPVLAGYIAYGKSGKPGLVPGFIGGYLAGTTGAGFLGAILAGLFAGLIVNGIKKLPVPPLLQPLMPIIIIPIISSLIIGSVMLELIGVPIANIMSFMGHWLRSMGDANALMLGLILGAMIAFDMGGPINKTAFFFGAAMIQEGHYAVMGAVAAAICVPPISMGLATTIRKKLWSEQEREAGTAAMVMGMIGITEGAIPFAVADPLRVIPSIVTGSSIAAGIAMVSGVGNHAPHGGPIVLPVIDERLMYIVAIITGVLVSAVMINLLKSYGQLKTRH
ncbi:fructose-specific PTS transporter subunit EIIC [Endozoicomonas sp. Mp262]|uniref:fructose-specific PTS transporter subunit EIIC n=1 Tax=Endozoicomonas sp. Mp262 TaxID=2919499 RepID=UPI0021D9BFDE